MVLSGYNLLFINNRMVISKLERFLYNEFCLNDLMVKEVSDRLVIFLVVVAVLVSFLGTYLVYINADNVPVERTIIVNQAPNKDTNNGMVSLYVNNLDEKENGDIN